MKVPVCGRSRRNRSRASADEPLSTTIIRRLGYSDASRLRTQSKVSSGFPKLRVTAAMAGAMVGVGVGVGVIFEKAGRGKREGGRVLRDLVSLFPLPSSLFPAVSISLV